MTLGIWGPAHCGKPHACCHCCRLCQAGRVSNRVCRHGTVSEEGACLSATTTAGCAAARLTPASGALQVWDVAARKLKLELPGHADEVFCVDWSPDGASVASGSKDRLLRLWRQ